MTVSQIVKHLVEGGRWKTRPGGNKQGLVVAKSLRAQGYQLVFLCTTKTKGGRRDVWMAGRI